MFRERTPSVLPFPPASLSVGALRALAVNDGLFAGILSAHVWRTLKPEQRCCSGADCSCGAAGLLGLYLVACKFSPVQLCRMDLLTRSDGLSSTPHVLGALSRFPPLPKRRGEGRTSL